MTDQRIRELRRIAATLYGSMLDNMGTHVYGWVNGGEEETVVLANIAQKIALDLARWVEDDNREE